MGTVADAMFANALGHSYQQIAQQLGDYLHQNIGKLPKDRADVLMSEQSRVISYANTFYSLSDNIAFADSGKYFDAITRAMSDIDVAIRKIDDVNRVLTITGGVISLAAAVVSQNGSGIVTALQSIGGAINL